MKTMKKVLSVLLLVCMLSSMCAVSAYADDPAPAAETGTLTISVPDVASTYEQWNATSELTGVTNVSAYTITWYYTTADGNKTATANSNGSIGWINDRLENGSVIYAVAMMGTNESTKIESNHVTVSYTDIVTGVAVSPNSGSLTKGGTPNELQLTATVSPANAANQNVTWSVSPTDVVSIDNTGKVTVLDSAVGTSNVTVTATSQADTTKSGTATINVTVPAPAPAVTITKVEVSYDDATRTATATPTFSDTGSHTVTWAWSSDKESVALTSTSGTNTCTLSNNSATDISSIILTATATAIDGTALSPTVPGSCTIASLPGKDKSMTIGISSTTLYAGREYTLSATDGSTPVTGVTFAVDTSETSGSTGSATISGSDKIQFGLNARRIKVTATASGYAPAEKYFDVTPNVKLSAGKSTLYAGKSDSTTLSATYIDDGKDIPSTVASWGIKSQTADALLSDNTLTAGSKTGTVECVLSAFGIELGTVTVTIAEYSAIDFTLNVTGNSTASTTVDTIYAKKGVITLTAANAIDTSKGKAAVSGTFKFSFASNSDTPAGGIGLTDHGDGVATVSGNYNGTYIIRADFYPTGATTSAATKYHTIYVNYTPTFVGGNYAVWDGVNGLDFLVDDSIYNYNGQIWVDGHLLSDANYLCRSSSDGRIWVTLKPEFISWLRQYYNGNGTHTIAVGINNRNAATGYFKTWGTASSFNGVKTGDEANLGLWITLLTVSAAGTAAAVVLYKRKKSNG